MSAIAEAVEVGDYDIRGRDAGRVARPGYIYVGCFEPVPGVLFVKCGKTGVPHVRARAYNTMLPGGLNSMWILEVPDAAWYESVLMKGIAAIDGAVPVGGEWFKLEFPFARDKALELLASFGGKISHVLLVRPKAFGDKRVWKYRRKRRLL